MAYKHFINAERNPNMFAGNLDDQVSLRRSMTLESIGMNDNHYNPVMPHEEQDLWKIINLHEIRGRGRRSSLLLDILQWCIIDGSINQDFFHCMDELGFDRDIATSGLEYCEWARLIEPDVVRTIQFKIGRVFNHYQLTPRGSYYLQYINLWPEYTWGQAHIGDPDVFRSELYDTAIEHDLIELLGHYVATDRTVHNEAKVILKTNDPMLPAYLSLPQNRIFADFLALYGPRYYGAHKISREDIRYYQQLNKPMVLTMLESLFDAPASRRRTALLRISDKGVMEIKREAVERAYRHRDIQVPNPP